MRSYSVGKPSYKSSFQTDLAQNFNNHFIKKGTQTYLNDVIMECEIYAMDICLHFQKESGGMLPKDWMRHMIAETYDAIIELFPNAANYYTLEKCMSAVESAINSGTARMKVDNYYSEFR